MQLMRSGILYGLSITLAALGAINWGLVALFRFNLVHKILGKSSVAERVAYVTVGLAGIWLGTVTLLPRMLLALRVRGESPTEPQGLRSLVGRKMPSVTGTTLSGRRITIPQDNFGKVAFLVMGFSYDSRFEVEDWSQAFRERFGQNPNVLAFEMPMIGGLYRLFAPAIDEGMRRGSPSESYDHVITVYASQRPLRQTLRAMGPSNCWVYLLDTDGQVLFQHGGPFDVQTFQELASLAESALAKATPRTAEVSQNR